MIRQRLLFPLPPKKRGKYRKLMHVCDAVDGLVRFRCKRCRHETDWILFSPWKAKRGVPCLFCNKTFEIHDLLASKELEMQRRPKVELHNAYFFVCDECGKDSFGRLLPIGQDERDELADDYGIAAAAAGSWLMRPDVVRCQWCDAEFVVDD